MIGGRVFSASRTESTPWPFPTHAPVARPALTVCPLFDLTPAGVQEVYRLAYERAVAEARPSRYDLALAATGN